MPGIRSTPKSENPKNTLKMSDNGKDVKSVIDKILGDISKTSATKQLCIGASTGWLTGYLAMKIGKSAAFAVGGGIILLEIANEKGYIKINWAKVNKKIEKVSDKVEHEITGRDPSLMDKVYAFVHVNCSLTAGFIGGFLIGVASH